MIKNLFGASWRTAVSGILALIGIIVAQIANNYDSGILGIGLNARDNKVSTEQARKDP